MEGAKRVKVVGEDDKHQITAVFGISMSGDFLPIQPVYQERRPSVCHRLIFCRAGTLLLVTITGVMSKRC